MNKLLKRISMDTNVCHGKPCIKGTRIMVSIILDNLADGSSFDDIIEQYPSLTVDDIQASIVYAAELAHEEMMVPLR